MADQSNSLRQEPSGAGLDRIDFELLSALQKNARSSNKELAARVRLAPSSCLERVRRLERLGIVRGAHAEVAPHALGIGLQALVFVRLARHSREKVRAFRAHVLGLTETVGLFHVTGEFDFLVHVAVRDADHLRDLALDALTTRAEVAQMETHLIFEHLRQPELPRLVAASPTAGRGRGRVRAPAAS